jgi:hypothetical protein
MRIDRLTKFLLGVIALGLWANLLSPLIRPIRVHAEDTSDIEQHLAKIEHDVHSIYSGTCLSKICE